MTKTILIVEDDELLRDLTAESLSSLYAVTITSTANADEALHHLSHEETPALVMTDIHMPGRMDGLGLAHVIWRRWPTLPVILTSGHAIIDTHLLPVRAAFLPKPWGITDLASLINKLVNPARHRGLSKPWGAQMSINHLFLSMEAALSALHIASAS